MSRLATASDYEREIAELRALIADERRHADEMGGSLSAEIAIESLSARLEELEAKYAELSDDDLPGHELQILMAGAPVADNKVRAEFLASVLDETQRLVHALVNVHLGREARHGSWPEDVLRRSTLQVAETFAGSFGIRLEALDEQLELEGHLAIQPAFDDLFRAVSSKKRGAEFLDDLAPLGALARAHLRSLLGHVSKADASIDFRWPLLRGEKRALLTAGRAEELAGVLDRIEEEEWLEDFVGRLVGSNIRTGFFELQLDDDNWISGRVSVDIMQRLRDFFDRQVRAEVLVTRVTDRGTATHRDVYRLMSLKLHEE